MSHANPAAGRELYRSLRMLVPILLLAACARTSRGPFPPFTRIRIPDSTTLNDPARKLSDLITPVRFIPLERNEIANIGNIDKLLIIDGCFYVLDRSSANCIFRFGPDGRFLGTIGRRSAYKKPNDISYNAADHEVNILDGGNRKLLRYSLSGVYEGDILLDFFSANYERYNEHAAFIGGRYEEDLVLTNNSGEKLSSFFPANNLNTFRLLDPFTKVNDSVLYFREYLNDTVYRVSGDQVYPAYYIDYGNKRYIVQAADTQRQAGPRVTTPPADRMAWINFFLESPGNVYFTFQYQGNTHYAVYRKADSSVVCFSKALRNDLTFDKVPPLPIAAQRDTFYAVIQPYSLIKSLRDAWPARNKMDSGTANNFQLISDLARNMTELSNPLIMAFTFKNNH